MNRCLVRATVLVLIATVAGGLGSSPAAGGAVAPAAVDAAAATVPATRYHGSAASVPLTRPVVGGAGTAGAGGYWLVASDGGIFPFGNAIGHGSTGGIRLNQPMVGMAATPSGGGYWLVAGDGGIFPFGNAAGYGSTGAIRLNQPMVGMASTPNGDGYWLVAADGGIFPFGSAGGYGSTGALRLNSPIVGMAATRTGRGYWLVGADGGIFPFGDAPGIGSLGGQRLNAPITGMAADPSGTGYWLVAADGGVFPFGATVRGSASNLGRATRYVGLVPTSTGSGYWLVGADGTVTPFPNPEPTLTATDVVTGLASSWDVGFLPDGSLVYTEKAGKLSAVVGGSNRLLATLPNTFTGSEAGLLGLAVDPAFATNRRIYVCRGFTSGGVADVRIEAYTVNATITGVTLAATLVSGLPVTSGRHSGCRPRFGPDGMLWVGTGDAAVGTYPQSDTVLGGKVLRITTAGAAAPGNPNGRRWWSKGHRNVQGIAFQPVSGRTFSVEHGTDRDDEVNRVEPGGNGGWDPVPGYDETRPMTDLAKFPGATRPMWTSGLPTIAPSGATFLSGPAWRAWDGALVMAVLKNQHLRLLFVDGAGRLLGQKVVFGSTYGRLRSVVLGPDGALYVTTSNGSPSNPVDRIFRLTPSAA